MLVALIFAWIILIAATTIVIVVVIVMVTVIYNVIYMYKIINIRQFSVVPYMQVCFLTIII